MPELPASRIPDRRREDPILRQLLEVSEATRATTASMAGRIQVLEREIARGRELRETLRIDDMSREQKEAFIQIADWWVDRREDSEMRRSRTEGWVRFAAISQAVTAGIALGVSVYLLIHH